MESKLKKGLPIEEYDQAIALNPNDAEAYYFRGLAYGDDKEDDAKAIEDYSRAIDLNPNYAEAYRGRGGAYLNTGHNKEALEDIDKAIGLNPNDAGSYYFRGWISLAEGKYNEAIEDYSQAILINPKLTDAYRKRGDLYHNANEYDKAINDYTQMIILNGNDALAYHKRGLTYVEKKDYDQAIKDYDQAISINPNNAKAFIDRGFAYGAIKENPIENNKKAIENIEKGLMLELNLDNNALDKAHLQNLNDRYIENARNFLETCKAELKWEQDAPLRQAQERKEKRKRSVGNFFKGLLAFFPGVVWGIIIIVSIYLGITGSMDLGIQGIAIEVVVAVLSLRFPIFGWIALVIVIIGLIIFLF